MFLTIPHLSLTLRSPDQSQTATRLRELWFPHTRHIPAIIDLFRDALPLLSGLGERAHLQLKETGLREEIVLSVEAAALLKELTQLKRFNRERALPRRFFFCPDVPADTPLPLYSSRRLPTGQMQAGFDSCLINRNWDGLDRIDDLTARASFEDVEGEIRIVQLPLHQYLNEEIERWLILLERAEDAPVELCFSPGPEGQDRLVLEVLELAERWRRHGDIPDYRAERLLHGEEMIEQLIGNPHDGAHVISAIGAYMAEVMRASWGGSYVRLKHAHNDPKAPPLAQPAVALELPFGSTVYPIEKVMQAYRQKRKISLRLHLDVIDAHRRQGGLQEHLARQLHTEELDRRRAVVRILCDINDIRVENLLIEHLSREQEPDLILRILERLLRAHRNIPSQQLERFALHPEDGVASRAISLLAQQKYEHLPPLIESVLAGGNRFSLRPLARQALETLGTPLAKKTLRRLGPIPLLKHGQTPIVGRPNPDGELTMTAEILEDCASPSKQEAVLRLFSLFPDREEAETLGAALADPDRRLRLDAIGFCASSDRPLAQQLLRTRLMFEEDPLVRAVLQEALRAQKERG